MRSTKRILLAVGIGAAVAGGSLGLAAATGSSSSAAPSKAAQTSALPAGTSALPAGSATVNVATATVTGKSEQILVDAKGLPLYTYGGDTSTTSKVSGGLAALWPPLVSGSPSESGANGKLTVLADANGQQVLYNGHFLYTFVNDTPGQVTGQGVQNFFVASPGLGTGPVKAAPPSSVSQSRSYGY